MEKCETWRTHGKIMDGDLWKHRLGPDFGSWWWWNFLSRTLFAFFFFSLSFSFSLFLLLINPLWIRQISKLMQMRVTAVAVSRPPLLCTCNDTERLSLHVKWSYSKQQWLAAILHWPIQPVRHGGWLNLRLRHHVQVQASSSRYSGRFQVFFLCCSFLISPKLKFYSFTNHVTGVKKNSNCLCGLTSALGKTLQSNSFDLKQERNIMLSSREF